jgi:hypothetical protein
LPLYSSLFRGSLPGVPSKGSLTGLSSWSFPNGTSLHFYPTWYLSTGLASWGPFQRFPSKEPLPWFQFDSGLQSFRSNGTLLGGCLQWVPFRRSLVRCSIRGVDSSGFHPWNPIQGVLSWGYPHAGHFQGVHSCSSRPGGKISVSTTDCPLCRVPPKLPLNGYPRCSPTGSPLQMVTCSCSH